MGLIKSGSMMLILAGILILIFPAILAYIIAIVLILIGLSGLGFGQTVHHTVRAKIINK